MGSSTLPISSSRERVPQEGPPLPAASPLEVLLPPPHVLRLRQDLALLQVLPAPATCSEGRGSGRCVEAKVAGLPQ